MKRSWPYFLWLILTAVALYYAKWPLLILAALVLFFRGYWWLCERYPRTMFTITVFLNALFGGRRGRW
jgi:MFS superfamily sulfate permease-like transporter